MNILRLFSEIYFNDIGERANLIPSESNFVAHGLIDEALTRKLNLRRLGLKYVDLQIQGVDMGEKPVTTVRKNLRQYTEQQFITEFLANAADADATEFTLLVNEVSLKPEESIQALSPVMSEFCVAPSLVVHNSSVFSDADFVGICRTSVGTKEGERGKIGQFGLGALTMFHFAEVRLHFYVRQITYSSLISVSSHRLEQQGPFFESFERTPSRSRCRCVIASSESYSRVIFKLTVSYATITSSWARFFKKVLSQSPRRH
jgi:sacsin